MVLASLGEPIYLYFIIWCAGLSRGTYLPVFHYMVLASLGEPIYQYFIISVWVLSRMAFDGSGLIRDRTNCITHFLI
jgi:hypothetical protein